MKAYFTKILAAGLLLFTTNAQAQWVMQSSGTTSNLFGLKFYDENNGIAVGWAGSSSDILRTTDGGKSWKKTTVPNTLLFSVDYIDQGTVLIAGYDAGCGCGLIKKSTDGGATWEAKNDRFVTESFGLYNVIMYGNKGYVSGYNGAIVRTDNGWGSGYTLGNTGTASEVFRVLEMTAGDTGFAAGGSSFSVMDHLYRTTDGTDWEMIKDMSGAFSIGSLYFVTGSTGFMVGSNGMPVIMKTTDAGQNWTEKYTGTNSSLLVLDAALAPDKKTGFAITSGGELLRTDDEGESWKQEQKFSGKYLSALHVVNKDVAYAVGQSGVIVRRSGPAGIGREAAEPGFGIYIENAPGRQVNIIVDAPENTEIRFLLTDIQGRTMEHTLPAKVKGSQKLELDGLKAGTYVLTAWSDQSCLSRRFVLID